MTGRPEESEVVLTELRREDVAALASIHRRSFSGFFLAQLGEAFLREFYRAFIDDPTAITVVARTAAGPVGVAVGTTRPAAFYSRLLRRRWHGFALAAARTAVTDPGVIPRLLRAVVYRGDAPEGLDAALFASMCVDPALGGQGVGARLSREWSVQACRLGAQRAYLTTDRDDNEAVNRHHQRQGWVLESQYVTPEGRRMNRYVKDLPDEPGASS